MASLLLRAAPLAALTIAASAAPASAAAPNPQDPCAEGRNPTTLCQTISIVPATADECGTRGGVAVVLDGTRYPICNGATGPAGSTGSAGATGATGADGATGAAGTNGTNGTNGVNGTNGTNGTAGAQGAAGSAGPVSVSAASVNAGATCVSRRKFTIRIKERKSLRNVAIRANGKTVRATRKNGRLVAVADFDRVVATRGQVVPVRITGRLASGKRVSGVRLYRLCTPGDGVELNIANNL